MFQRKVLGWAQGSGALMQCAAEAQVVCVHMCVYPHTSTHIHTHMHTYTYIHTYTYMYTHMRRWKVGVRAARTGAG